MELAVSSGQEKPENLTGGYLMRKDLLLAVQSECLPLQALVFLPIPSSSPKMDFPHAHTS